MNEGKFVVHDVFIIDFNTAIPKTYFYFPACTFQKNQFKK